MKVDEVKWFVKSLEVLNKNHFGLERVKNRIIDVSKKVAKTLDFHEKGTTKVKVEYLKSDTDKLLKKYGLK